MRPERDLAATTDPLAELRRVLESFRRAGSFEALALADTQGLLIAGAGQFLRCEELAAHAAEQPADTVARFELLGTPVLLCAQPRHPHHVGLDAALTDELRIQCAHALGAPLARAAA